MGKDLDRLIEFLRHEVHFEDEDEERTMTLADAAALKRRIERAMDVAHEEIRAERAAQRQGGGEP